MTKATHLDPHVAPKGTTPDGPVKPEASTTSTNGAQKQGVSLMDDPMKPNSPATAGIKPAAVAAQVVTETAKLPPSPSEAVFANQNSGEGVKPPAPAAMDYTVTDISKSGVAYVPRFEPILKVTFPAFVLTLPGQQELWLVGGKPVIFETPMLATRVIEEVALKFYKDITKENTRRITSAGMTGLFQDACREKCRPEKDNNLTGFEAATEVYNKIIALGSSASIITRAGAAEKVEAFFSQFDLKTSSNVIADISTEIAHA